MKATLLTSAIALCALTALAADQQQAAQQQQTATATGPQQTTLSATTQGPQQQDSPLVAAAKRSGRLGKTPGNVITNETLLKSGGHFTTTKSQSALPDSPKSAAAGAAAAAAGATGASDAPLTTNNTAKAAEPKKPADNKAKAAKSNAVKRAAAAYEGDSVDNVTDDPAVQEGVMSGGVAPKPGEAGKPAAPKPPTE